MELVLSERVRSAERCDRLAACLPFRNEALPGLEFLMGDCFRHGISCCEGHGYVLNYFQITKQAGSPNAYKRMKRTSSDICFVCGEQLLNPSSDHVPPKNLFLKPRPTNLISLPSCDTKCNQSFKLDDEFFRLVVSQGAYAHSEIAKVIWNIRVVKSGKLNLKKGSSFERSPALRKSIVNSLKRVELRTPSGIIVGNKSIVEYDQNRLRRVILKIVRGLFKHHFSELDINEFDFVWIRENTDEWRLFHKPWEQTNRQVIREDTFWYNWVEDTGPPVMVAWELWFYQSVSFYCIAFPKETDG